MISLYIISAIIDLVAGGCHFHAFWACSKPHPQKAFFYFFFQIFATKDQKEDKEKIGINYLNLV